jgi:hypothetical protein
MVIASHSVISFSMTAFFRDKRPACHSLTEDGRVGFQHVRQYRTGDIRCIPPARYFTIYTVQDKQQDMVVEEDGPRSAVREYAGFNNR